MAYIKPTLTIVSNATGASTDPGPLSFALNLSAKPLNNRLDVDDVQSQIYALPIVSSTNTKILDGDALSIASTGGGADGDASDTANTHGCWIYMKNITGSGTEFIYIGCGAQAYSQANSGSGNSLNNNDDASARLYVLRRGEFAFFPFDYLRDFYAAGSDANQILEVWRFDRAPLT